MIKFTEKIKVQSGTNTHVIWARHYKVGTKNYDKWGKRWEVGEDINFDKFWFREVK